MRTETVRLLTVREIAETLCQSKSRVLYALRRLAVPPAVRASQTLLFGPEVLLILRTELGLADPSVRPGGGVAASNENGGAR